MVLFNHSTRELTAKIVYYGPGLCGKTTNLRVLHERLEKGTAGRLLSLATAQDRTIYFDLLPVELGNIKGYTVRFQLCTVPGQVFYNETRKLVLRGVDGVVFVVDSQWSMVSHNLESWQNLVENLRDLSVGIEGLPVVIQYNKRDLPGVLTVDALQESLGFPSYPFVEAIANSGHGVVETFKLVTKLTFVDLLRRLQRSGGIESDVFSVPSGAIADPGDETQARPGRAQKRSSFADTNPGVTSSAPVAALADKEQPFGDAPGWMPPTESDVFSIPPPARATDSEPFAAPAQTSAPPPESIATVADILELPEAEAVSNAAEKPEPVSAMTVSLSAPDPGLREAVSSQEAALAGMRGEMAALREELQAARTQLGTSVETLASSLNEKLAGLGADLFSARGEAERARDELAEAHRALVERVEKTEKAEEVEKLVAGLRASDEAREALIGRLSAAEQELSRSRAVVEEAHRHIDERLGAAERRTRSLADSIRKALDEIKD